MLCRHERRERELVAKRRVERLDEAPLPRVEARVLRVEKHLHTSAYVSIRQHAGQKAPAVRAPVSGLVSIWFS